MGNPAHEAGVVEDVQAETLADDVLVLELVAADAALGDGEVGAVSFLEEALPSEVLNSLNLVKLLLVSFVGCRQSARQGVLLAALVAACCDFVQFRGLLLAALVEDETGDANNNHESAEDKEEQ